MPASLQKRVGRWTRTYNVAGRRLGKSQHAVLLVRDIARSSTSRDCRRRHAGKTRAAPKRTRKPISFRNGEFALQTKRTKLPTARYSPKLAPRESRPTHQNLHEHWTERTRPLAKNIFLMTF